MDFSEVITAVDEALGRLRDVGWKERDGIRDELVALIGRAPNPDPVRQHLESSKSGLPLELRWEIDEVLEVTAPPVEEPEEPEEEPEEPGQPEQLSAADLNLVYDDPRGLLLYKTKKGERWFATQRDPRTGQPKTFELHPQEVQALKLQLKGSPYWVIGSGEGPGA